MIQINKNPMCNQIKRTPSICIYGGVLCCTSGIMMKKQRGCSYNKEILLHAKFWTLFKYLAYTNVSVPVDNIWCKHFFLKF